MKRLEAEIRDFESSQQNEEIKKKILVLKDKPIYKLSRMTEQDIIDSYK